MSKYPEVLSQLQPQSDFEFFFMFTLKVLSGTSFLSKGSACDFWVSGCPTFLGPPRDDPR